jgi:hypothetical protein
VLPWHQFAVIMADDDIPRTPEILGAITPRQLTDMRRALACAWPRVVRLPTFQVHI